MTCYSIPAMSMENEFVSLGVLAGIVDDLVQRTGDNDYAVVYEWEDFPGDGRPVAVYARVGGRWWCRVLRPKSKHDVNGH